MGTTGISGLKCGGKYKLFSNSNDGYPSGLGQDTVDFAKRMIRVRGLEQLEKNCKGLEVLDWGQEPTAEEIERNERYAWEMDSTYEKGASDWALKHWTTLQKGLEQGAFYDEVYSGNLMEIPDGSLDTGSYMYIINLDTREIDFYLDKDYAEDMGIKPIHDLSKAISEYHELVGTCPLDTSPYGFSKSCGDWKENFFGGME